MCGLVGAAETTAHKKGRCKRSGQSKTLDPGATNQRRCTRGDGSKRSNHLKTVASYGAGSLVVASRFPAVLRESPARISLRRQRKNSDYGHAPLPSA